MNWRVWTSFFAVVAVTAALGAVAFLPDRGRTIEQSSEYVTGIHVDLERPYEGTVTVTYAADIAPDDDLLAVVAAQRDIHVLLEQYYVPYEDPDDIRVSRRRGEVSMSFPLIARERLEFLFPEATLAGSWRPLWESLHFTVVLPAGYEVAGTAQEGLEDDLAGGARPTLDRHRRGVRRRTGGLHGRLLPCGEDGEGAVMKAVTAARLGLRLGGAGRWDWRPLLGPVAVLAVGFLLTVALSVPAVLVPGTRVGAMLAGALIAGALAGRGRSPRARAASGGLMGLLLGAALSVAAWGLLGDAPDAALWQVTGCEHSG